MSTLYIVNYKQNLQKNHMSTNNILSMHTHMCVSNKIFEIFLQ